jgi:hypothetical protein
MSRSLTYAERAEALKITPESANRLACRKRAENLIAARLREADERRFGSPERRPWWRRLAG